MEKSNKDKEDYYGGIFIFIAILGILTSTAGAGIYKQGQMFVAEPSIDVVVAKSSNKITIDKCNSQKRVQYSDMNIDCRDRINKAVTKSCKFSLKYEALQSNMDYDKGTIFYLDDIVSENMAGACTQRKLQVGNYGNQNQTCFMMKEILNRPDLFKAIK